MNPLPGTPALAKDIREVQIELTEFCDADCAFCINRASFAKEKRSHHGLPTRSVEQILTWIAKAGIARVRFTGGEPLLRRDLLHLVQFAQRAGLATGVNTNGHLPDHLYEIAGVADFILLSFVSADAERTDAIFRRRGSHALKLRALSLIAPRENLWISTVIQKSNIGELLEIGALLARFGIRKWILLRPEDNGRGEVADKIGEQEIDQLIAVTPALQRLGIDVGLGNAFPVCAARDRDGQRILADLLRAGDGGLVSEGRSKLVIDPSGRVLCHYGIDTPLGEALDDLEELWRHPIAARMRDASDLPIECTSCEYLSVCLGGSRIAARAADGTFAASDPLMSRRHLVR